MAYTSTTQKRSSHSSSNTTEHMRSIHKKRKTSAEGGTRTETQSFVRQYSTQTTLPRGPCHVAKLSGRIGAAPGVDVERQFVSPHSKGVRIAVKPDAPLNRDPNLKLHVVFMLDSTFSMTGTVESKSAKRALELILESMAHNVEAHLSTMESNERELVSESTDFAFAAFGKEPRWIVGAENDDEQFVSVQQLGAHCSHVKALMDFSDDRTDIASAILFATEKLQSRISSYKHDKHTRHVGAIALLTDGMQNAGKIGTAFLVRQRMDQILSDMPLCSQHPAIFGIGLGDSTDPSFLSGLVSKRGYWTHVPDPSNAAISFNKTVENILNVKGTFDVRISATRKYISGEDDTDEKVAAYEESFESFGLLGGENQLGKRATAFFPELDRNFKGPFKYEITVEVDNGRQKYKTEVGIADATGNCNPSLIVGSEGLYKETTGVIDVMKQLEQHLGMANSPEEENRVWETFLCAHSKNEIVHDAILEMQSVARQTQCFLTTYRMLPMPNVIGCRANHSTKSLFSRL